MNSLIMNLWKILKQKQKQIKGDIFMAKLKLEDIEAPIDVIFKQRVAQMIAVGEKGVVLFAHRNETLINEDTDADTDAKTYILRDFTSSLNTGIEDEALKQKVVDIFDGGAVEVLLFEHANDLETYVDVLNEIHFDWGVSDNSKDQTTISTYTIENELFGVGYNVAKDNMSVVNFTNPKVTKKDGTVVEALDYLPKIAGVLAGCPYSKSVSYKVFTDLQSVTMPEIEKGALILKNDEDGVRFASPVNSLITLGTNITEDMKSICIVEGMRRLKKDVRFAFKNAYKGNYKNHYDNQCLFITAVKAYLKELEKLEILDPSYDNTCDVDIATQREKWIASGKDEAEINALSDQEIRELTYKDMVFLKLDVKFLNAMEGLQATVEMF